MVWDRSLQPLTLFSSLSEGRGLCVAWSCGFCLYTYAPVPSGAQGKQSFQGRRDQSVFCFWDECPSQTHFSAGFQDRFLSSAVRGWPQRLDALSEGWSVGASSIRRSPSVFHYKVWDGARGWRRRATRFNPLFRGL